MVVSQIAVRAGRARTGGRPLLWRARNSGEKEPIWCLRSRSRSCYKIVNARWLHC